jgi:hypothetical protein
MDMVLKVIGAFGIGLAAMWGLNAYGMFWAHQAVRQAVNTPKMEVKAWKTPDTSNLIKALHPKLDPNIGKNIPMGAINQQINQHIYAGKMVPLPPRIPSVPGIRR